VSFLFSLGWFFLFQEYIQEKDLAKIEFRGKAVESLLEKSFHQNLEVIYSIQNLFYTRQDISRQQFKDFVANSLLRHPGIQAIEHMIKVNDADRAKYESRMQAQGFFNFSIKELNSEKKLITAGKRAYYHVINYAEPLQENIAVLGYDVSYTPEANDALLIAQSKGIGISPWLTLAQGDLGFVVYLGIQKTEGFAAGVFKLKKFIENALESSSLDGIDFILEEVDTNSLSGKVLRYASKENKITSEDKVDVNVNPDLVSVNMMSVGHRTWRLTYFPSNQYKSVIHPTIPYVAAITVFLLMLSVTFFLDERDARVSAQTATKVREEFMTVASHELRTPLTPLKMEIFLVRELVQAGQTSREKIMSILDNANKHLNHIVALIDDLLDVGRIGEEHYKYNFSRFNIDELVLNTVEKFEPVFRANGCKINLSIQPSIQVNWDAQRIEQVLANCLSNSVKFSNQAVIDVKLFAEGSYVIFSIKDNGIGISEEFQKKMFNKFERGVSSQSYGGLGLGLYIVHQIIKAHGGVTRVNSSPGQGAEFIFQVPPNV
jgi:signal transduction histidine kinase